MDRKKAGFILQRRYHVKTALFTKKMMHLRKAVEEDFFRSIIIADISREENS